MEDHSPVITVNPHGNTEQTNCFDTIQEALDHAQIYAPYPVTIRIVPGIYEERLEIWQPNLTIEGEDAHTTTISWHHHANEILADGEKRGTFRTATLFINTHHVTLRRLSLVNSSGPGRQVGQALAVYADGDCLYFDQCRLLGWQDTLFTGPLPPTAYEKNGFRGPKEFDPRINGRHYYRQCFIAGEVDFIFGSATAFFDNCELYARDIGESVNGYAAAASTPEGQEYGYVFNNCRFTGDCPPHSAYLGRPWRSYARTILTNCHIGSHIRPEGFHDWGKADARKLAYYAEYHSVQDGMSEEERRAARPDWVHQLSDEEAAHYTRERVLGDWLID